MSTSPTNEQSIATFDNSGWVANVGIMPCQLERRYTGPYAQEKDLWAAVLSDAIFCYQHPGKSWKTKKAHAEAERWIKGAECPHCWSYAAVCEALDINPDYLRNGLSGGGVVGHRRNPTVRAGQVRIAGKRER
jgi:hypothetical protein